MNSFRRCGLILFCVALVPRACADESPASDAAIKQARQQHWAFQPVRPSPLPPVRDTAWVRNVIDTFVLAKLEARGWQPAPVAEPRALLRRVYLNLIGLP